MTLSHFSLNTRFLKCLLCAVKEKLTSEEWEGKANKVKAEGKKSGRAMKMVEGQESAPTMRRGN